MELQKSREGNVATTHLLWQKLLHYLLSLSMFYPKKKRILALTAGWLICIPAFAADCVNGINTANCTVPAGATSVVIEAWGGGGGGGGAAGNTGNFDPGGGGGGGSYCKATFAVTGGTPLTIVVGTGGAAGDYQRAGGGGTPSSVTGAGVVGMQANAGTGGAPNRVIGTGGTTAACTAVGATAFSGGNGSNYAIGGGGGGSATPTANGGNGVDGAGGTGTGIGGNGGQTLNSNGNGLPGSAPGGGGGGGDDLGTSSGGAGGGGRVAMTFTIVATPASAAAIPTLGEWGMILLSGLMVLTFCGATLKRSK